MYLILFQGDTMPANKFANFVLISGILCFLITLVYDLYRIISLYSLYNLYKLHLLFAGISIIGIVICFFAFRLRQDYKINLVLTGLSILVGVYLVEIFLFYTSWKIQPIVQARKMGIPFDTRAKPEIIKELKEQGMNTFPSFYPSLIISTNGLEIKRKRIFPLGGVSRKTTVYCNESGQWSIYESDEHGFNNPTGVFEFKEINMVLVGDSYTHGACVKQGEDIASQLRKMLGAQIINLGIGGNGPLLELASLKEYGEPLKPKDVLWMYYEENDLMDLFSELKSSLLLKYRDNQFSQNLINKQSEIDSILIEYIEKTELPDKINHANHVVDVVKLWHLRQWFGLVVSSVYPDSPPLSLVTDLAEVLKSAKNLTSSWGGKVYFVYFPSWRRYARNVVEHGTLYHRNQVLSTVQSLDIPIIDIHDKVFATHPDPLSLFPLRIYGHYTNEGYRLVAQAIQASLKNF
jgi:hypothetical protein